MIDRNDKGMLCMKAVDRISGVWKELMSLKLKVS